MAITNLPKLNFSVPFAMTAALPVEYNAYFSSYDDAVAAAATAEAPGSTTTVYYYGQKIVVVGESEAKLYIIQPDKTLKEAGGVPLGDGGSISVSDEGKIGIEGFSAATANQQPRIKVQEDGTKIIEWYTPDTSTVEGLQQTVGSHTTQIGQLTTGLQDANTRIDGNDTSIATLNEFKTSAEADISKLKTDVSTNTAEIAKKANSTDVYAKTETYNKTEVENKISSAISSVYKPAGSVAFAGLPALSADVLGNVYNVTNKFTTTADFVEGAGQKYPAGTNVVIVSVGDAYKYDVLSGMTDLTDYYTKAETDSAIDADIKIVTDGLADGTIVAAVATKATQDGNGNVISTTYAKESHLVDVGSKVTGILDGTYTVEKASKDAEGNVIDKVYATKAEVSVVSSDVSNIKDGTVTVDKASKDAQGRVIDETYATKTEVTTGLSGKVDKVEGKQLSSNDFTTELKDKLEALPAGAQVNAIDTVSSEFTLSADKELSINAIDKSKVTGLDTALDTKLEKVKISGVALPVTEHAVELPGATASALGLVKGSSKTNDVTVNADFTMTVNNISTDKLVQGTNTLIWNGGSASES